MLQYGNLAERCYLSPTVDLRMADVPVRRRPSKVREHMDTTDLVLAIVHHLLVFSLAGIIGAEFVLIRGDLPAATLKRLAGIDRHYGIIAALIIIVGIGRVFWG